MHDLGLNPFSTAKKAGLHPDYVRNILRGKAKQPGADRLARLAEALECSLPWLLGQPDPGPGPQGYDLDGAPYVDPGPLPAWTPESGKPHALLLPIRYELLNSFRRAPEVRRDLGFAAATIPAAYADREQWYEVVRDDSAGLVAPMGALLHVVKFTDNDRPNLGEGAVVIVERHHIGPGATHYLIERSVRIIRRRYPEQGLWFFEYATDDEEFWGVSDDLFRSENDVGTTPMTEEEIVEGLRGVGPIELREDGQPKYSINTPEEMAAFLVQQRKLRPRIVGKVVRVLTSIDHNADFGAIPDARSVSIPKRS
jgi:transcriptional regulator with XRE-family HTH domain